MAADEYYDAVGEVLSYVLSAEDFVIGQIQNDEAKQFSIRRDGTHLDLYAEADKRYFMLVYQFSLSSHLSSAYETENQLLREHMERYDVDEENLRDKNLSEKVAVQRMEAIDDKERIVNEVRSLAVHSDCRINSASTHIPWSDSEEEEIWDGIVAAGLLYPYEDSFGPREYEQVAQEVISVGNHIDKAMEKLGVMDEIGFEST